MDEFNDANTKQLRKLAGLQVYKPGVVSCLKCDKTFKSWDTRLKRICSNCLSLNEDIYAGMIPEAKLNFKGSRWTK